MEGDSVKESPRQSPYISPVPCRLLEKQLPRQDCGGQVQRIRRLRVQGCTKFGRFVHERDGDRHNVNFSAGEKHVVEHSNGGLPTRIGFVRHSRRLNCEVNRKRPVPRSGSKRASIGARAAASPSSKQMMSWHPHKSRFAPLIALFFLNLGRDVLRSAQAGGFAK